MQKNVIEGLFAFLDAGVSPFHAVAAAERLLCAAGFSRLEEGAAWQLAPGGRYYTTRNQSSIVAWRMPPDGALTGWHAAASHSDAPAWRLKNTACADKYYAKAAVEGYGGMIMSSWLDRPLSVAGRVLVRTPDGVKSRLIAPDRALLCIPSQAIHQNRGVNDGYKFNPQVDLQPVYGMAGADLADVLTAEAAVCPRADVLSYDLVLCVRQQAVRVGLHGEWFMAPRIDDLECAYTTLRGFLAGRGEEPGRADVWAMFDNEEVGSSSRQGAQGTFLADVMARIEESLGLTAEQSVRARAGSLLLSADNGHAVHPNHPEKSDPANPTLPGGGVLVKVNASQKYTTSGLTAALFGEICRRAEVPVQTFYNRADQPGGSTLGNLLGHQISIPMVDIGLAQLAMHAAVETAACADAEAMVRAAAAFYNTPLAQTADGVWSIG